MRGLILLIVCAIVLLSVCGCSRYIRGADEDFYGGEEISPDKLRSLSEALTTGGDDTPALVLNGDSVFYWTNSGTKLHIYKECGTTDYEPFSGNLCKAYEAGLNEPCKRCLTKAGITAENFPVHNESCDCISSIPEK